MSNEPLQEENYSGDKSSISKVIAVLFARNKTIRNILLVTVAGSGTLVFNEVYAYSPQWFNDFLENLQRNSFTRSSTIFTCITGFLFVLTSKVKHQKEIDALKARNKALEGQVIEDGLTCLLNRKGIDKSLTKLHSKAKRHEGEIHVLFIDLDDFKHLNEEYGHVLGGDVALKEIARKISETAREEDYCGRWGGDEFVAIIYYDKKSPENMDGSLVFKRRLEEAIESMNTMGVSIINPSRGYEKMPIGASIQIHVVDTENSIEAELNAASEKMLAYKKERKRKKQ